MIEELKELVNSYISNGGNLDTPREKFPSLIKSKVFKIINYDYRNNIKSTLNSVLEEIGYKRNALRNPITLEGLKSEIDKYVLEGGSIYDPKRTLPYYERIHGFARKKGLSTAEVYALCGYEYDPSLCKLNYLNSDIFKVFETKKDENGYIDDLLKSDKSYLLLKRLRYYSKKENVPFNSYLMMMYGVRVKEAQEDVNYVEEVEKSLKDYVAKYGTDQLNRGAIEKNDSVLASRLRHLSIYFPEGSVTFHQLLSFFGYSVKSKRTYEFKDEEEVFLKDLLNAFPDKKIGKKFQENNLYYGALNYSLKKDMTLKQYFEFNGFEYAGLDTFSISRLSKMFLVLDNEEIYDEILSFRNKLLEKYDYYSIKDNMVQCDILNKIFKETYERYNDRIVLKPKV